MNVVSAVTQRMRWVNAAKTPASAVAYSFLSRISIFVVNIATGIFIARSLGPEGRGATGAINLWMLLIPGLLTLGVPAALRYEVRRKIAAPPELFSCALIVTSFLGLAAIGIGVGIIPFILVRYPPPVIFAAQLMMLFAPLNLWNTTVQAFYESQGDFKRSNAQIYLPPFATLGGMTILHLLHKVTPYSFALMYPLPIAAVTLATLFKLRNILTLPQDLIHRMRSMLHYGLRAYGIDIINALSAQIDQAMVVGLLSASSFGFYAVAIAASAVLSLLGLSLNAVLFPTASGRDPQSAVALVSRSARIVSAITFVAAIFVIVLLPLIVPIAYGRAYLPIVAVAQTLCVGVLFASTAGTLTQAFMATGRPEIATFIQAARIVIALPLMIVLIPRFGLMGAAYGVVTANAIRLLLAVGAYPVFLHHKIPRLILTAADIRAVAARLRLPRSA